MSHTDYNFPPLIQGETWDDVVTIRNSDGSLADLTGATARLTIRKGSGLTAEILTDGDLTSSAGLTLGGTAGTVAILRSAAQTKAWPARSYFYELKVLFNDGKTRAMLRGRLPVEAASADVP